MALLLPGCSSNPYARYLASNPGAVVLVPDPGADLERTVAAIYAPTVGGYERQITSIQAYEYSGSRWNTISLEELPPWESVGDYALVTTTWCRSTPGPVYYNANSPKPMANRLLVERRSWYLLPSNRLEYFDHYDYVERCGVFNDYKPAVGRDITGETQLLEQLTESPPAEYSAHLYRKAIRLARIGRVSEALALYDRAESQIDPAVEGLKWNESVQTGHQTSYESAAQHLRQSARELLQNPTPR